MDEKLQAALAELINKANQAADGAVSFMSAELPDVIHQLLVWYSVKSAIMFAISIIVLIAWFHVEKLTIKATREAGFEFEETILFYGVLGSVVRIVPALIVAFTFNINWLKIWIAPKIWLIEYAASLAK